MAINIEIIKVEIEQKGKYQVANIMYKTGDGKPDNKKIVSFDAHSKDVFKTLVAAQPGDIFDVVSEKIEGYWKWTAATSAGKNVGGAAASGGGRATTSPRSTYETPEERAARQVYIVRQSSISNAVELLKDPKKPASVDDVIDVARQFEAYVFGTEAPAKEMPDFLKEPDIT